MTPEQKKAVESYAFERSVDYQPLDDTLPINEYFRYGIEIGMMEVLSNPEKYGLQPKTEWVSVEDRLPEDQEEVLIHVVSDIVQAYYKDGYWKGSVLVTDNMNDGFVNDRIICKQGDHFDFVTHWQPLPQPPADVEPK